MSLAEITAVKRVRPAASSAPIRVAVVGCGAISEQMHLPALAGWPGMKLTALVDRDVTRARRFAEGYGVKNVLVDAAGLTRDVVDGAIIATPPAHHAPCAIELMRKGIHVLVEKPMATRLADAERMVAEADAAGVVLAVGFFRRLNPSIRLMKALLDSGWAGRPQRVLVEGGGMYNWAAATLGNMRRDLAGGGVLIDFGTHMLDLMFALFDEPAELVRYEDNALGGIESDCAIEAVVRHAREPVEARIELARTRELGSFIRVECERATLEFQVSERFRVRAFPREEAGDDGGLTGAEGALPAQLVDPLNGAPREFWFDAAWRDQLEDESWYETFGRQFDDWTNAIRTGGEPILSGRSALATSRLIDACYSATAHPIAEAWVQRGVTRKSDESLTNGAPRPPAVHVGGHAGRVLVTGASGFIGSRVVELLRLREQRDVRALVHNPGNASRLARLDVEMVQGDLGAGDVKQFIADCDSLIHCAIGTDWAEPRRIYEVTVGGTRRLAEAARAAGLRRLVHVSTMSVYGDDGVLTGVIDESSPVRPMRGSVYGKSKAQAEQAVLEASRRGLPAVVFRPARVYGPFSRIFVTRPLQAIAKGTFQWLMPPDVPADMVYVDNVSEALIAALYADAAAVTGQAFNIGDGDSSTWRDFYDYFARRLGLDLSNVTVAPPAPRAESAAGLFFKFPLQLVRNVGQIVKSAEFKSLGRRVLITDPLGTLPRKALESFPSIERTVRKMVGADDSLPVYSPPGSSSDDRVHMGSGGSVLSIEKLRRHINFTPPVSRAEAMQLTLDWVRHARIV
jgi:predicted dehydrogenase/nucleoside-diphosphate-sugar epimerase